MIDFQLDDEQLLIQETVTSFAKEKVRPAAHDADETSTIPGFGLGLSIAKTLVEGLDGQIMMESELGKGSTFRVVLPWSCVERPQAAAKLLSKLDDLGGRVRRTDVDAAASVPGGVSSPQ